THLCVALFEQQLEQPARALARHERGIRQLLERHAKHRTLSARANSLARAVLDFRDDAARDAGAVSRGFVADAALREILEMTARSSSADELARVAGPSPPLAIGRIARVSAATRQAPAPADVAESCPVPLVGRARAGG